MKKLLYTFIVIAISTIVTACTHNGGPTGPLFGRWHLERVEADNLEAPTLATDYFIAFQSHTVMLQRNDAHNEVKEIFGNFTLTDNTLFLHFPGYILPPVTDLGFKENNILQILKLTHRDLILLYNPDPDKYLTYYFRKW